MQGLRFLCRIIDVSLNLQLHVCVCACVCMMAVLGIVQGRLDLCQPEYVGVE